MGKCNMAGCDREATELHIHHRDSAPAVSVHILVCDGHAKADVDAKIKRLLDERQARRRDRGKHHG